MINLYNVSEKRKEELQNKYNLLDFEPYGELHKRLTVLRQRKHLLEIEKQRNDLSEAQKNYAKLQADSVLDPSKKKEVLATRKRLDELRFELENSEALLKSTEELIVQMMPEYEEAKSKAISELSLVAKKEHIEIAKRMYKVLKELSEVQLQEMEFRYALGSAVGMIPSTNIVDLQSYPGLSGREIIEHVGDENIYGTRLNLWASRLKKSGYNL